ncbi:MAG: thioesterase [Calditrichaceae bacterium]|jgi:medium-chain acyl-[acyl-carrier-protein] hydrolase
MSKAPNLLWSETFKVRAYEVGPNGKTTVQSIFNYLQEAAGNHAAELGVSIEQLFKQNLTWVLSRVHLHIDYYPSWKQAITIETWPADKDAYYAIRDFRIMDENMKQIGMATSSWMMLDIINRKPVLIPEFIEKLKNTQQGRALNDRFEKLPKLDRVDITRNFNVRMSDLDINQHVNSVNYIEWAMESIPNDIFRYYNLTDVEVTYRAESKYGDIIHSQCHVQNKEDSSVIIHKLERDNDGKEIARLKSTWLIKKRKKL